MLLLALFYLDHSDGMYDKMNEVVSEVLLLQEVLEGLVQPTLQKIIRYTLSIICMFIKSLFYKESGMCRRGQINELGNIYL